MGPAGSQGLPGNDGAAGAEGAQGPVGPIGPQGTAGNEGAAGPAGAQGPIGLQGTPGANGAAGLMGPAGPVGANGAPGTAGAQGPAGPAGPAGTTRVPFFGSSYFSANALRYIGMGESDATETKVAIPLPVSGVIGGLQARTSGAPNNGGGTQSYTFALMVNGAATSVTCAISEAALACSDLANTVTVAAGDRVSLRSTPGGTPTAASMTWSFYITQ